MNSTTTPTRASVLPPVIHRQSTFGSRGTDARAWPAP